MCVACATPKMVIGAPGGAGHEKFSDQDGSTCAWIQFSRRIQICIGKFEILTVSPDMASSMLVAMKKNWFGYIIATISKYIKVSFG